MTAALRLYDLADDFRAAMLRVEDADGELTEDLERELDALTGSLEAKVAACIKIYRENEVSADAAAAEAKRVKDRERALSAKRDRLKAYIKDCLERAGLNSVDTPVGRARVQDSPPSAKWVGDVADIPEPFQRVKTIVEFDAKGALSAFNEGADLDPRIVVSRGKHLTIR